MNPVISKSVVELEVKIALYGHKTFEYEFCTCTPKLPNQDTGDIVYNVLIGCFSSMETKFIEYSFNWKAFYIWSKIRVMVRAMVFNATFNNISLVLWWSVLLVEETGVSGENHWQTLSHNVVLSNTPRHERDF